MVDVSLLLTFQKRFADNQKNNAKKKVDNRELTARRNSEYMNLHGCPPPSKPRIGGGGKKRAASTMSNNESETASSPPAKLATKRQKAITKNNKTTTAILPDAGERSSAGQNILAESPVFLNGPDSDVLEFYQHQDHTLNQHQRELLPQQQSFTPQQYYNPPQRQQAPDLQQQRQSASKKSGSGKRQKNGPRGLHTQTVALGPNPDSVTPVGSSSNYSNDIENQIVTTLADAVRDGSYAANPVRILAPAPSNGASSTNYQTYQQTNLYQTQNAVYPDISAHLTDTPAPAPDLIAEFQVIENHYKGSELEHGTPAWYSEQQFHRAQVALELTKHGFADLQFPPFGQSGDIGYDRGCDPYWGGSGDGGGDEATDFSSFTEEAPAGLDDKADAGHQEAVDPQILDQKPQDNKAPRTNFFQDVDMNAPGFGDLDFEFDDLESGTGSLFLPHPMDATSLSNTGGQAVQHVLGGQNKMREMEEMLAADP